jgi:N-acetylglucosaminyl-diphospho-decaprenol L-rhamnosyltransferase
MAKNAPLRGDIAVVIVAYHSGDDIQECLESIVADRSVVVVYVIDNSSDSKTRDCVERLAARDYRIRYTDPGVNLGFARGCNLGARLIGAKAEFLAFVNPDMVLSRSLAELADALASQQAAVASGLLTSVGSPESDDMMVNARPLPSLKSEIRKALSGSQSSRFLRRSRGMMHVGQVDGALLVLRRATFNRLGGFDEQFELYYEDVDLCRRASSLGGCVLFADKLWGVHKGRGSSQMVPRAAYCMLRISRLRYFRKARLCPLPGLAAFLIGWIEFAARSVSGQPEGTGARFASCLQQTQELVRPGSASVLLTDASNRSQQRGGTE